MGTVWAGSWVGGGKVGAVVGGQRRDIRHRRAEQIRGSGSFAVARRVCREFTLRFGRMQTRERRRARALEFGAAAIINRTDTAHLPAKKVDIVRRRGRGIRFQSI